jgi:hypothetical protein
MPKMLEAARRDQIENTIRFAMRDKPPLDFQGLFDEDDERMVGVITDDVRARLRMGGVHAAPEVVKPMVRVAFERWLTDQRRFSGKKIQMPAH